MACAGTYTRHEDLVFVSPVSQIFTVDPLHTLLPSDSKEVRRLKFGPRLVGVSLLVFLAAVVVAVVGAKPAWHAWRQEQAMNFVRQARAALDADDQTAFLGNLRAANNLAPTLPEVLRLNGEHYSRYRHSDGLIHWHQLRQTGAATREDLLQYARLAIHCDRTELAREIVKPLHYGAPNDAEVLVVLSELFEKEGDLPQAREAALDAITRNPRDAAAELRVARLELASQRPAQRIAARGRLYALMAGTNRVRVDAAFALMLDDRPSNADYDLIVRMMDRNPVPSLGEKLATMLVSLRRKETTPEAVSAGLKAFLGREPNPWERMVAAERLGAAGEFNAVLDLLPEKVALTDRNLAAFRLGALASLRDSAGMERFLKDPGQPLPRASRDTYWATAAALAYLTNETPALWRTALASCGQDEAAVKALAIQAENAGATDTAVECWNHLLPNPAIAPQAASQLLRIAERKNDPRGIYLALRRLASLRPGRIEYELPLAFYQALLELEPGDSSRILSQWEARATASPWFAAAKALFLLRNRQPDRAVQQLEAAAIDWDSAPAVWMAVRIAALGESGDHTGARQLARNLVPDRLSALELNLVSSWLPPAQDKSP